MSLLDQARQLEGQVVERLKELEPLIAEYNQLRQLAERLGVSYTPPEEGTGAAAPAARGTAKKSARRRSAAKPRGAKRTSTKPADKRTTPTRPAGTTPTRSARKTTTSAKATPPTSSAAKPTGRRSARKAAGTRPGQRSEDVLRLVGEQPGISVREIGERLGVDATGLYRVANKHTADGRLRKDGTKLYIIQAGDAGQTTTAAEPAQSPDAPRSAGAGSDGPSRG
jgi:hypothetical protein